MAWRAVMVRRDEQATEPDPMARIVTKVSIAPAHPS
jgi:hypothetical protein